MFLVTAPNEILVEIHTSGVGDPLARRRNSINNPDKQWPKLTSPSVTMIRLLHFAKRRNSSKHWFVTLVRFNSRSPGGENNKTTEPVPRSRLFFVISATFFY